jgi:uncharacterized protein
MKFHVTTPAGQNLFTGYGDGYVAINNERYEHPVLVSPEGAVESWDASSFEALTREHFEALLARTPELVLLGTGETLRFARPELTRVLATAGVGFEAMDTKAACRTFNILMAEGRRVIAAILV